MMLPSQKIATYYDRFKGTSLIFTKDMIQVTGLIPGQVCLKCGSELLPCVIYSSSLEGAKIVANLKSGVIQKLAQAGSSLSLKFCFRNPDNGSPAPFFVQVKSAGHSPYGQSQDMAMVSLQFTQRPPDDLIAVVGRVEDANVNASRRREDWIPINPETSRRLKLVSRESAVYIQEVPRPCILRTLSFSGAKIAMTGVAKFLVGKEAVLHLEFEDPGEKLEIPGKFVSSEPVESQKGLVISSVLFDEPRVLLGYKLRINDYFTLSQGRQESAGETAASPPAASAAPAAPGPAASAAAVPSASPPAAAPAGQDAPPAPAPAAGGDDRGAAA